MPLATVILLAFAAPQAPIGAMSAVTDNRAAVERPLKQQSWVEKNSYNAFVAIEETPATPQILLPAVAKAEQRPGAARGKVSPII